MANVQIPRLLFNRPHCGGRRSRPERAVLQRTLRPSYARQLLARGLDWKRKIAPEQNGNRGPAPLGMLAFALSSLETLGSGNPGGLARVFLPEFLSAGRYGTRCGLLLVTLSTL